MMKLKEDDLFPATPGKVKIDRALTINRQFHRCFASTGTMFVWALFLIALTASYLSLQSFVDSSSRYLPSSWGGMQWEKQIRASATPRRPGGKSVLLTGAAGFVGTHVSLALRKRGDGVVGLDNFNNYYDPSLKKARKAVLASHGVFVVEGDINDARLLAKLFDAVPFSHVMHLAAQAGVRYAIENPASYVHSNIAGLVTLLEACKSADPQPSIVWASSSSVYGLNEKVPFSELDRTDSPASLYAATKKAGEEITHTYNHIYGLSITGLRFFTVYGPWGRPDMAYFSFTRNILHGKPITVYRGKNGVDLARDFTYIDDIVKGCVASLDTAAKSTGSGGRKQGPAQYRIFNLGNTSPVTVPALVRILEQNLKVKAKIHEVEMPGNGDVPFTHANISYARADLGYNPTTNLEAGLRKFVKWYLSYYGYNPRTSAKSSKSLSNGLGVLSQLVPYRTATRTKYMKRHPRPFAGPTYLWTVKCRPYWLILKRKSKRQSRRKGPDLVRFEPLVSLSLCGSFKGGRKKLHRLRNGMNKGLMAPSLLLSNMHDATKLHCCFSFDGIEMLF